MSMYKPQFFPAVALPISTFLNSLGIDAGMQTAFFDNSHLFAGGQRPLKDLWIEILSNGAAGSTAFLEVYCAISADDGTTYVDGATGTAALFTAAGRRNAIACPFLQMGGTAAVRGAFSLRDSIKLVPEKFALILINKSGGILGASGHAITVQGVRL